MSNCEQATAGAGSLLAVTPAALLAVIVAPLVYRGLVGETDLSEMVAAIVLGHSTGLGVSAGMHYNYTVSFAYYLAIYALVPGEILADSARLMTLLNIAGWVCACSAVAFLGLALARIYGLSAALLTTAFFAFSPMYLELATSCHPMLPALMFLSLGLLGSTYMYDKQVAARSRVCASMGAILAWAIALCFRVDFLFAFPFLAVADKAMGTGDPAWRRRAMLRSACLFAALLLFVVARRLVVAAGADNTASVRAFFSMFYDPDSVIKGLVVLLLGTGLATSLCALLTAGQALILRVPMRGLIPAIALAAPTLVFWIPNPTPVRHMLLAILGTALVVGMAGSALHRKWHVVAVLFGLVVGNQLLADATYPLVASRYPWSYAKLGERRSTYSVPVSSFLKNHYSNEKTFAALREEARHLVKKCDGKLLVVADQPFYILMALAETDGSLRIRATSGGDRDTWSATGLRCQMVIVQKYRAWPKDVLPEYLRSTSFTGWPIYFQELTRGVADKTAVPADRGMGP